MNTNPQTTDSAVVHLVAPPSTRRDARSHYGRTIPCLLLAGALQQCLTPNSPQSRTVIIGDSTAATSASALGLEFADLFTPVLQSPRWLKSQLLHHLKSLPTPPTKIICWSDELAWLSCAVGSSMDIPTELISTKPSVIKNPPQNIDSIYAFDSHDHDWWLDHRHVCKSDQRIACLIAPSPPTFDQRNQAREALGIDAQTICLAAIADAPNEVDAREFAFLLGLLSVSGYPVLGIVPRTASNLNQALRHHRGLGKPFRFLTTTDPLPDLLPLLDACIHPTDERSGSADFIERYCKSADIPIMRMRHSGKAGFSRAQGSAGKLLDQMDEIAKHMQAKHQDLTHA